MGLAIQFGDASVSKDGREGISDVEFTRTLGADKELDRSVGRAVVAGLAETPVD